MKTETNINLTELVQDLGNSPAKNNIIKENETALIKIIWIKNIWIELIIIIVWIFNLI